MIIVDGAFFMIKICQIPDGTSVYPPDGADTSAWETHRISTALTDLGQKVTVVTLTKPKHDYVYNLIPMRNSGYNSKYLNKFVFAWTLNQDFCRLLEKERYDVVHFQGIIPAAFLLQKVHGKIPTAVTCGDPFLPAIEQPDWVKYIAMRSGLFLPERLVSFAFQKYVLSKVDVVLPVSNILKKKLIELFDLPETKIEVINPGVDTYHFRPSLEFNDLMMRHHIENQDRIVMCPARIVPLKNQEELVKVLPILKREFKHLKMLFVGEPTNKRYFNRLLKLSKRLGVTDDIIFTGTVSAKDFPRYYNMADAVVLPSISEGFPSSLLESMSCGRPTVASDILPNMEVGTHMEDIVYYKSGHLEDLAEKISQILEDRIFAMRIAYNARRTVLEKYNWSKRAHLTLHAYLRAIQSHGANNSHILCTVCMSN